MLSINQQFNLLKTIFVFFIILIFSCKSGNPTIVGVWQPVSMELPENIKNDPEKAKSSNLMFEQSKFMSYHFHSDSSFSLKVGQDIPELQNIKGTYSVRGKAITINFNTMKLQSEIAKLTDDEMQIKSEDNSIIFYKKIND